MLDSGLLEQAVLRNVQEALAEDIGSGDVSAGLFDPAQRAVARVITRQAGVFCGRHWVEQTVLEVGRRTQQVVEVDWHTDDRNAIGAGDTLFELHGAAADLLTAERTMLNFVQLLSGTASKTARYVALLRNTRTTLLDTRKTLPGLRMAQKYAVLCGGAQNHRIGLFDAFLLKENHIAAAGSIGAAVAKARDLRPELTLEVETENLIELQQAIDAGADIAMIDNFSLEDTRTAVAMAAGRIKLEASGGIDESSIVAIAAEGVDYISVGELTKNVDPLDLSMRFV